ncbi:MAG TPA: AI-2E family transporter [Firmicutes bacterium]|nr:AI-2E family transporter [Bacillota bacterium]
MTRRTRVILLVIAASVVVVFLYAVRAVLTPFILAAIAAYLANPLVMRFESRQMPRSVAIISTYIICGISAALIIYLIVPVLIRELNDVLVSLPQQLQGLNRYAQSGFQWLQRLPIPIPIGEMTSEAIVRVQNVITTLAARSLDLIFGLFSSAVYMVLVPFLAYYFLRDKELISEALLRVLPTSRRPEAVGLLLRLNRVTMAYIRGQLIISAGTGALVALGLTLLGVKYAALAGLIAGIFDVAPYFGPVIGAIPAVLLGLLKSPSTALWCAVWITLVQQIESMFLQPRVMSEQVGLHPLTVIFAVMAGGQLLGIWGMLVAVPLVATGKTVAAFFLDKLSNG